MNRKISQIPSPALAGVVKEKTLNGAIAEIMNCTYDGADMIDLHLPYLEPNDTESLRKIVKASRLPILALNYSNTSSEEERVASFLRAVDAGAAGIDMQGYTFHLPSKKDFCGEDKYSFTKGNPKEIVTDESIIAKQYQIYFCLQDLNS